MTRRRFPRDTKTSARRAEGRERIVSRDNVPSWLTLTLDAIQRQHATSQPLDKILAEVQRARRVGGRERRQAADAAFAWARHRKNAEREIDAALSDEGGIAPRRRDRDHAAVLLALLWTGEDFDEDAFRNIAAPLARLVEAARDGELPPPPATLPGWLDAQIRAAYDEPDKLIQALVKPAPVGIAVDTRHTDDDAVVDALTKLGVSPRAMRFRAHGFWLEQRVNLSRLPTSLRAHVWPMDEGSQLVCTALDAKPDEMVLDLCAGGGGKSRLLTTTGANIIGTDVDRRRVKGIRARTREVPLVRADGAAPPFPTGVFDRILVDAPCSGTGTIRRAPDIASRLSDAIVAAYPEIQTALLQSALNLVKLGGRVVYATCSLLPAENDGVIDDVNASRDDVRLVPLKDWAPPALTDGVPDDATRILLRPDRHGTDGFFIAVFEKQASSS